MALNFFLKTRLALSQSLSNVGVSTSKSNTFKIGPNKPNNHLSSLRFFKTSSTQNALSEFLDDPNNYGVRQVKSGRAWRIDELRLKSNSDLHKLWFVLYKERNMLYTMQEAAKEEGESFPSPERIDKVEEGMANLENVVRERNKAYWQLEVSPCATGERPSVFRRDIFGRSRWHKCSQHLVPFSRNNKFRESRGPGKLSETEDFFNSYRDKKRTEHNANRNRIARYIRDLLRRFPNADIDYIAELHPIFPPGYIKHLRDNLHLYDDPPRRAVRPVIFSQKHADLERPFQLLK